MFYGEIWSSGPKGCKLCAISLHDTRCRRRSSKTNSSGDLRKGAGDGEPFRWCVVDMSLYCASVTVWCITSILTTTCLSFRPYTSRADISTSSITATLGSSTRSMSRPSALHHIRQIVRGVCACRTIIFLCELVEITLPARIYESLTPSAQTRELSATALSTMSISLMQLCRLVLTTKKNKDKIN